MSTAFRLRIWPVSLLFIRLGVDSVAAFCGCVAAAGAAAAADELEQISRKVERM